MLNVDHNLNSTLLLNLEDYKKLTLFNDCLISSLILEAVLLKLLSVAVD